MIYKTLRRKLKIELRKPKELMCSTCNTIRTNRVEKK